ncbi:MAG: hypothetical protein ACKPKO_02415, partial [Candidatus Fonsibacter sp.]
MKITRKILQRAAAGDEGIDNAVESSEEEPIEVLWDGRNWQEIPDEGGFTISNSEPRLLGTKCPICQHDFTTGQMIKKCRCGHAVCLGCFHEAVDLGWYRCTLCRSSSTARTAIIDPDSEDLSVFIQPENSAAAAAAAVAETSSSSDDFLARHIVVENLIKHHRDSSEKFDNAIDSLLDQLLINRDKRNE